MPRLATSLIVLLAGFAFRAAADEFADKKPPGRVSPSFSRIYIPAGKTRQRSLVVETVGIINSIPLDVLLLADISYSMQRQLDPVRASAREILERVREQHPDVRFGVASFSDYFGSHSTDPRDYPWRLDQAFTTDVEQVRRALEGLRILHGGDGPESYARALFEAGELAWRPEARKVIIVFGDSVAHGVDPGRDAKLGTADDLRIGEVSRGLAAKEIMVIGIFEPKTPAVSQQFEAIAQITGGHAIPLRHGAEAPAAVLAGLARTLRLPPHLTARPEHQGWVTHISAPQALDSDASVFNLDLLVPNGAAAGRQRVRLVASQGSDKPEEIGEAEIEIVTGAVNHPTYQFLAALVLVALPLLLLFWRALAREDALYAYYFSGHYRTLRIASLLGTLVTFAIWTIVVIWTYTKLQEPGAPPLSERLTLASKSFASIACRVEYTSPC